MLKPLADEVLEYATASTVSGLSVAPFQPFNAGDIVRLQSYVQFRVTTTGRIDPNTYRMRSFSAIGVSQGNNGCGYGLGPYGLTPYGCGLDIAQGPPLPPPDPYSLNFSGNVILGGSTTANVIGTAIGIWTVGFNGTNMSPGVSYIGIKVTLDPPTALLAYNQWLSPISGYIVAISLASGSGNIPANSTVTARININGVSQSGVSATIVGGASTGMGTGLVPFQTGDLMAVEFTVTGNVSMSHSRVLIAYTAI